MSVTIGSSGANVTAFSDAASNVRTDGEQVIVVKLSSTKFAIVYAIEGKNDEGISFVGARVGSISGTTITLGSETRIFTDADTLSYLWVDAEPVDSDTFLVVYAYRLGTADTMEAVACLVGPGDSISTGTPATIVDGSTAEVFEVATCSFGSGDYGLAYTRSSPANPGSIYFHVLQVSGSSIIDGGANEFDSGMAGRPYYIHLRSLSSSIAVALWGNDDSGPPYKTDAVAVDRGAGDTYTFGSVATLENDVDEVKKTLVRQNSTRFINGSMPTSEDALRLRSNAVNPSTLAITAGSSRLTLYSGGPSSGWPVGRKSAINPADDEIVLVVDLASGDTLRAYSLSYTGDSGSINQTEDLKTPSLNTSFGAHIADLSGSFVTGFNTISTNERYLSFVTEYSGLEVGGKAIGVSVFGSTAWVTMLSVNDELLLGAWDLSTLTLSASYSLGSCTEAQLNSETYIAYPFAVSGTQCFVFGRMQNPQSLGDPTHVAYFDGATWSAVEQGWGTDICGGLDLWAGTVIYAIRNLVAGGARLYKGDTTGLSLASTSLLNSGVEPHGITVDPIDITVLLGSRVADSIMVVGSPSPHTTWYDLTSDHQVADGVNAIEIL